MRPIGLATGSSNFPLSYKSTPFSRPRCPSIKQRLREPERVQKFSRGEEDPAEYLATRKAGHLGARTPTLAT